MDSLDLTNDSDSSYCTSFSGSSTDISDTDTESDDGLYDLIQKLQALGRKAIPLIVKIPQSIDFVNANIKNKYALLEKRKTDQARIEHVPISFEKVSTIVDSKMDDGNVVQTTNRASKIFHALATAVYESKDALVANQVKIMYLKQIEKDYTEAKQSKNEKEIRKFVYLVNRTMIDIDEPWSDDEWVIASKAFFAPIHVRYICPRVPHNPHIKRYAFSPALDEEAPIRIVVNSSDYIIKPK